MKNFIGISRKLFNHYLWTEKRKYSKFEAWLDLLQLVSYVNSEENRQMIRGKLCKWNRGQFPVSISFLAVRWKWGSKAVRNYLVLLQKEKMISLKKASKWTILTICKYEDYNKQGQPEDTIEGIPEGNQKATKGQKVKESKELKYSKEVKECYEKCLKHFPIDLHPKKIDSWLDVIDKLNRLDGLTFDLIEKIVQATRGDDFWRDNFLSITKLRRKNPEDVLYRIVFEQKFIENGKIKRSTGKGSGNSTGTHRMGKDYTKPL